MNKSLVRAIQAIMFCLLAVSNPTFASSDYQQKHRFGPGDSIAVSVYGEPGLSFQVVIDKTGTFDFPFIGTIETVGKTTESLRRVIDNGLRGDYLVDPEVTVTIVRYRPYFINGEVRKPGSYPYTPGMSVIRAVVQAGGFTNRAAKDKIIIQREDSKEQYRVHSDAPVRPGDIVTIKESIF